MVLPTPSDRTHEFDIDAGVIKDARARQRRQWWLVCVSILIGAIVGLLLLGGSGGGGSGAGDGRGGDSRPSAGAHTAAQIGPASLYSPPTIGVSGLLSPGVGWAVNGLGFYMTWDGGRRWSAVHVPGLIGDVLAGFMAADSPSPTTLVLAIVDSGSAYGTCADPAGTSRRAIGDIAVSRDAGRTWRSSPFPGCRVPLQISFLTARTGFAVAGSGRTVTPELLYGTTDGGEHWHRIGRLPRPGSIDFTSPESGWLLGGTSIYRTSNAGQTWQHANVCRQPAGHSASVVCGPLRFFGTHGVVQIIRAHAGIATGTFVDTTADGGLTWATHPITVSPRVQGSPAALVSAASPDDLFAYFRGGVLERSSDGGHTWHQLPAPRFRGGAAINFINSRYGWIQDGGSLYATSDAGQRWHRMKQKNNHPPDA